EARQLYERAATSLEGLLDARLLGIVLGNFGTLELAEGHLDRAQECLNRSQALLEQSGDRRSEGLSGARASVAFALAGKLPEAERCAARAQRSLRKDPFGRAIAKLLHGFVDLARAERAHQEGFAREAAESLARAIAARDETSSTLHEGRPIEERSDDIRLYRGMLEPRLARLRDQIART
ncbi:MAG TPA: hypothetical protein VGI70_15555, partial [Polyangiales bacterium]